MVLQALLCGEMPSEACVVAGTWDTCQRGERFQGSPTAKVPRLRLHRSRSAVMPGELAAPPLAPWPTAVLATGVHAEIRCRVKRPRRTPVHIETARLLPPGLPGQTV